MPLASSGLNDRVSRAASLVDIVLGSFGVRASCGLVSCHDIERTLYGSQIMKIFLFQEKLPSLESTLRITCLTSIILAQTMADFLLPSRL